jgi:hypothetical protein
MAGVGIALELSVLLVVATLGTSFFAVFEVDTPGWRKALKWGVLSGTTLGLSAVVGHWALLLPLFGAIAGLGVHVWRCTRHGIDPVRATPRRRYYELRGWSPPE